LSIQVIHIKKFEGIEKIDLLKYEEENPLLHLPDYKHKDIFIGKANKSPIMYDIEHWEMILRNHYTSVISNFAYAMHYFYKGIPDDEWMVISESEGSVEYFPHFKEEHYSNLDNFCHFIDVVFLKAFSIFEAIGHLLYKFFELKLNDKDRRDKVSFRSAVAKLQTVNQPLYKELMKIIKSPKYTRGVKLRNQITHNHPPYTLSSGVNVINGETVYSIPDYTSSKKIKNTMVEILESIKTTLEILERHIKRR